MQLSTPKELRNALLISKKNYEQLLEEGMPRLLVGNKIRFIKEEVAKWIGERLLKQENLEKSFVDAKGRKIEHYMTIGQLKECLQLKKKKIVQLCEQDMPYVNIGEKMYFQFEEVLAYFSPKEINRVIQLPKSEPVTIIVDGSYHGLTAEICTGMVVQNGQIIQGFSKLHNERTGNSIYCEYLAIYEALLYAKKHNLSPVILGTDQKDFVRIVQKGEKKYFSWMKKDPYLSVIVEMYKLIDEMGENLSIVYANVPRYNVLYQNAHALSRHYKETKHNIAPGTILTVKKTIDYKVPTLNLVKKEQEEVDSKNVLQIKFDRLQDKQSYFIVETGGKSKITKLANSNPTRAALLLINSYVYTSKEKMTVYLDGIPSFQQDLDKIYGSNKINEPKRTTEIIEGLYQIANFYPKNDFKAYLEETKEKVSIA